MLLRLFLIAVVLYLGYRFAKRIADRILGPLREVPPRHIPQGKPVKQRPPEVEEAVWQDVTPQRKN